MSDRSVMTLRNILAFAAVIEFGTGLVLAIDPAIVIALLLGTDVTGLGRLLGRCFGITLLALGMACWPSGESAASSLPAFRAMLTYNLLIALYFAYLGTARQMGGILLWPGAALHAAVALLLIRAWHRERTTKARDN